MLGPKENAIVTVRFSGLATSLMFLSHLAPILKTGGNNESRTMKRKHIIKELQQSVQVSRIRLGSLKAGSKVTTISVGNSPVSVAVSPNGTSAK